MTDKPKLELIDEDLTNGERALVERITKGAMTAQRSSSPSEPTISIEAVHLYRRHAVTNRYTLIRVRSRSKVPLAREWQRGFAVMAVGRQRRDWLSDSGR